MKKLNAHICNYLEIFDAIAGSKRGSRRQFLEQFRPTVETRYIRYESNTAALHTITPIAALPEDIKEALLHCYQGRSKPLEKLKNLIRDGQPAEIANQCQYCGVDTSPTYDHYLPKDIFPEFAVLAINLVPCCYACNEKKKSKWRNQTSCLFFHLYFDDLPDERILHCDLIYENQIPTASYSLIPHHNIPTHIFSRAEDHYAELKLFEKFSESSNSVISEIRNEFKQYTDVTAIMVTDVLRAKANGLIVSYGPNYWKVAICEALLMDQRFIDSCVTPA